MRTQNVEEIKASRAVVSNVNVRQLFCGASNHPGGGVTGGRATAQVMMEDMGIDFKTVVVE